MFWARRFISRSHEISSQYILQASQPRVNTQVTLLLLFHCCRLCEHSSRAYLRRLQYITASFSNSHSAAEMRVSQTSTSSIFLDVGEGAHVCCCEPCPVLESVPCARQGYQPMPTRSRVATQQAVRATHPGLLFLSSHSVNASTCEVPLLQRCIMASRDLYQCAWAHVQEQPA